MGEVDNLASDYYNRYKWRQVDVRSGFEGLYRKYVQERKQDIVDALAIGTALQSLLDGNEIDVAAMPDNVREAFHEAFPNLDIDTLNDRGPAELEGLMNAWNGKLFEVEIRDQLNSGMQVGDWQLETGQHAELAESATQPGWDLKILNEDGSMADVIQLKATDSTSYINEALERYPDVPIITTSDMAGHGAGAVSIADISADHLHDQIGDSVDANDSASDALIGTMPATLIAITEGFQVWRGEKSVGQAIESGVKRGWFSLISGTVGALVTVVGGPWLGVPAAALTRIALSNAMDDSESNTYQRRETVINPYPEFAQSKPVTRKEAEKTFKELEQVTDRLRLEYKVI